MKKQRYIIYYRKYNIFGNCYLRYIRVVETEDIYHIIGKMICTTLEKIEQIWYSAAKLSLEKYEAHWTELGYRQIDNSNDWVNETIE